MHVGNFLARHGQNRQMIEELADRLEHDGWIVHRTSTRLNRPLRLLDMAASVWRLRREYCVGHLAVFSGPAFLWAEAAALAFRMAGRPFVISLHGGNLPEFARRWPGRVRRLLKMARTVVAPSRYLQEALHPYRHDLLRLPNAIDLRLYPFGLRRQAQPRLVWLRAFEKTYNPTLACEVMRLLAAEHPQVQLTMVGPDKGDDSLARVKAEIQRLNLAERVTLPGPVAKDEVPGVLNHGDVFLNTTNVDNTPVSVIEAMACGLCVVSTNVGGVPFLIEHEQDGLLVPPEDAPAMAAAVRRVLTEPGLAERLSRNARAKAEGFDWSVVLPQWERLLYEAASEGDGPAAMQSEPPV
jgi:glycosyltransferase involved in cell wall biosynthesis